jgi:hypothetical protein
MPFNFRHLRANSTAMGSNYRYSTIRQKIKEKYKDVGQIFI